MEELYATGFNAWNQLRFEEGADSSDEPDDISSFTCVLRDDEGIDAVWPFFSYTLESFAGFSDVVQVVAYDTGFAALSSTGQVYTWGDERFAICLGRDTDDDNPAHRPALVEDLQDLPTGRIVKIAAAGYILAALTAGNDLYCWGHPGRSSPTLNGLTDRPSPIDIDDNDIADVGVGESHLIALTSGGQVYVVGDNTNGQLVDSTNSSWTEKFLPNRTEEFG
ncbi:regulator of chromosome condensation 1/beta-lactamase-inhibitor protein II [Podospora didyma]|uniref:Regulator of chromosome condensation 1/beta-lactamase-inhibitor protein II n=1 Tax=Podospora didyma TaxID=330526 RepID=A0AAE0NT45_9PEZI|nr:regulator of chromosome condensation 1/beta-lactamase-inhibitor protein II [Podospora didyma]